MESPWSVMFTSPAPWSGMFPTCALPPQHLSTTLDQPKLIHCLALLLRNVRNVTEMVMIIGL